MRDVKGFENLYAVTEYGRVFSKKRQKFLKNRINTNGYEHLALYNNNKKIKYVHRLVAIAFIPNPENKPEVNHKDGCKTNNKVDNLEWCTSSENTAHAVKSGLHKAKGEYNPKAKLTEDNVREIRKLLTEGNLNQSKIANIFNVGQNTISRIKSGRTWSHIK